MAFAQSAQILLVTRRDPQDPIGRILRGAGYPVVSVDCAPAAMRTAERSHPALIVADPRALSTANREQLAAFADEQETPLLQGWPTPEALLSEVERLLGQPESRGREAPRLVVGPMEVDLATHVARIEGTSLDLTALEFNLLAHFARHPGWVYSRQELLEQVWGYEYGDPRVVTVHIANLRKKLEAAAPDLEFIETVRNVGYRLVAPQVQGEPAQTSAAPAQTTEAAPSAPAAPPPSAIPASTPDREQPPVVPPLGDERRLLAVLFARLSWLTDSTDTRDPEEMLDLANTLFEEIVPCLEGYGGRVDRFIGDSVMVLFGAPVAHDNDAEMAVRAALDVRSCVETFNKENQIEGLSVHMGVGTGLVVVGLVGHGAARQFSVIGDAVNAASHLAESAGPGEIRIDPETFRIAGHALDTEPAETVKVDGETDQALSYRVKAAWSGPAPSRIGTRGISSELVGREEQLARFRGVLDRLEEGTGSVIFVVGDPGIGKSRLTAEIRREAASRNLNWLEGRTLSYGQTMSYLPFKEVLQADCGIDADDPADVRERKLRKRVERLFADRSGEFLPVFAALLGLPRDPSSDYQLDRPDEAKMRDVVLDQLTRYVSRLGTEKPLLLAFEDVHWLDRSSASLVENLLPLTFTNAVAICLVGRENLGSPTLELVAAARRHRDLHCVNIALSPLSARETRKLVNNLLGGSEIDPRFLRTVERKSEGNPFFVEEILRHFMDSGSLYRDEQSVWHASKIRGGIPVPSTLKGVIAARIDQLPQPTKAELLRASVIGRSFLYQLLASLTPADEGALNQELDYLVDHQLIFLKRETPELEYAFKHALVQEAAYDSILAKQRKGLHLQLARAIEELFSGRIEDLYGILAYHYTKAEDWAKAQDYLLKAGDQSVSMAADGEAVAQYEEAMAALLRGFDQSWDTPESHDRVAVFVRRIEPFWLARCLGDLLDSVEIFHEKVLAACGPADPRTVAATAVLAGCHYQRCSYDQAAESIEATLESLEQSGAGDDPSLSRLLLLLGLCRLQQDRFSEAEEVLARGLEVESAKGAPDEGLLQDLYVYLSSSYYFTSRYEESIRLAEQALDRFDLDGTQRYWMLLLNLSGSNLATGKWGEAAAQARQCFGEITNPYLRAAAARHLGEARHVQGAYLEAEEHLQYAVATFGDHGDPTKTAEALKGLAEAQLQAGKLDEAEETVRKAIRLIEAASSADHSDMASVLWTLAGVEMERGHLAEADRLIERSARLVREKYSPRQPMQAELLFRRAQLRKLQGQAATADEDCRQAIAVYAELGGEDHPRARQMTAEWEALASERHRQP